MSAPSSGQGSEEIFPVQEAAFPSFGLTLFQLFPSSSHMYPSCCRPPQAPPCSPSVSVCVAVSVPPVTAVTVQGWDVWVLN